MILFRYFRSGIDALGTVRDARLKVSCISSFNDPFECMFRPVGKMTAAKAKEYVRSRLRSRYFIEGAMRQYPALKTYKGARRYLKKNLDVMAAALLDRFESICRSTIEDRLRMLDHHARVVCFSEADADPLDEILMWSHYGAKHCGARVGFEFPAELGANFKVRKITYENERVPLDFTVDWEAGSALVTALARSIESKSNAWKYEKEHRLIVSPRVCIREGSGEAVSAFVGVERGWIKRVDFGARHPSSESLRLRALLGPNNPDVQFFQAGYDGDRYALTYNRI